MKRLFSIILATLFLLCCTIASAEGTDNVSTTEEEPNGKPGAIQTEPDKPDSGEEEIAEEEGTEEESTGTTAADEALTPTEGTVIVDQDGVQVYFTGENEVLEGMLLKIGAVVVNDSDKNVTVMVDQASINGREVPGDGIFETSAGKEQKSEISFLLEDAGVSTMEEIEELEMEIYLVEADAFERISDNIPVTLTFPAQ